jgi:hypothetical protein
MKKMLKEKDVLKIIEQKLPELIEKYPALRLKIEEIIERKAVTKEEIKEILIELRKQREENNKRFEELVNDLKAHREENNRRFEAIDKRFEEMDRRFEALVNELKAHREETAKRFEAVDKRFEEMDRRFEALVNELKGHKEETAKRFEELTKEMNKGFELLRNAITALGARWGIFAEEAFREGMKGVLEEIGFSYYEIKKWEAFDEEGFVYGHPSMIEVDLVIRDQKHYLIEIKSSVSTGDVFEFKKIGEFYEKKTNIKPELIIISPYIKEEAKEKCNIFKIKYYKK